MATGTNNAPTGGVTISGTATQGQTLTATNTLADLDGLGTITYQWSAAGLAITGATASTYTLTQGEVGKAITVTASYTDGKGTDELIAGGTNGAVSNVNDAPTGAVTIGGTVTRSQTLTATNTLADLDGLGAISYQWNAAGVAIGDATANTYTLTVAQVGKAITVTASYTDGFGAAESATSSATNAVTAVNSPPTGTVAITDTAARGQTLTATNTLADLDGLATISYQWSAAGVAITGATASSYTLTAGEVGKTVNVLASYTDLGGTAESVASSLTGAVRGQQLGLDYQGDGKSDILWRNDGGLVAIWQMNGATLVNGEVVATIPTDWKIQDGAGDYNGDGKSDFLWRNDNGQVAIWQMNGSTLVDGSLVSVPIPADWKIQDGAGDYNGDGKSDILWRNDAGLVAIWQMNGATLVSGEVVATVPTDWKIQEGSGDYNGDGKSDLLWRNDNGQVAIWQMNGANLVDGSLVSVPIPADWKIQDGAGDYNGDGKSDILWRNDAGLVAIWQMNGATLVDGAVVGTIPTDWKIQDGAGDYNADGKSDFMWRNDNGQVAIWQMNGATLVDGSLVSVPVPADWTIQG